MDSEELCLSPSCLPWSRWRQCWWGRQLPGPPSTSRGLWVWVSEVARRGDCTQVCQHITLQLHFSMCVTEVLPLAFPLENTSTKQRQRSCMEVLIIFHIASGYKYPINTRITMIGRHKASWLETSLFLCLGLGAASPDVLIHSYFGHSCIDWLRTWTWRILVVHHCIIFTVVQVPVVIWGPHIANQRLAQLVMHSEILIFNVNVRLHDNMTWTLQLESYFLSRNKICFQFVCFSNIQTSMTI